MNIIYRFGDGDLYYHHGLDQTPNAMEFPRHAHSTYEVFGFICGQGKYHVENTVYPLEPGSILLFRPAEHHQIKVNPLIPYERVTVLFSEQQLKGLDPEGILLSPFTHRPLGQGNLYAANEVPGAMDYLLQMSSPGKNMKEQKLDLLCNLVPLLYCIKTAYQRKGYQDAFGLQNSRANQVITYINDHLFEDLSLDRISDALFISKSQLNRIMQKAVGQSAAQYVTTKRLVFARARILTGEPANAASQASGFKDYSTFYRAYKKQYGHPPTGK